MIPTDIFHTVAAVSKKTKTDVFVVGGYVRDTLLGFSDIQDVDFVVAGSGLHFARAFAEHMGKNAGTLVEFEAFDTARFVVTRDIAEANDATHIEVIAGVGVHEVPKEQKIKKEVLFEIEFAGARKESYRDTSRKPSVEPATIEEDLSRRDFTVNAIAQQVLSGGTLGDIIDPFGGQKDLEKRLLKTPLDPNETFSDDPLRMMRAARFASQLIFEIEPKTYLAMKKNAARLKIVSPERILDELMKTLATFKPSIGLWILYKTELFDQFLPEISDLAGVEEVYGYSHKDNLSHTFAVVDNIAEHSNKTLLRFAGLMHDIAKPETKKFIKGRGWTFDMHEHLGKKKMHEIGKRLRMSRDDIRYVSHLVRWHLQPIALMDSGVTDNAVRRLIVSVGDPLKDLLILCRADITTGNQQKKERRLKNYDHLDERINAVFEKDTMRAFQSPIRGEEIMQETGLKAGPTIGKIKKRIEDAILDGEIPNEYEAAKAFFLSIKDDYLKEAGDWEKAG